MKKLIFFILFVVINICYSYKIECHILRSDDRTYINNSIIVLKISNKIIGTYFTDTNGICIINNLESNKYILEIKSLDYHNEEIEIDLKNKDIKLNIYLTSLYTMTFSQIEIIAKKNKTLQSKNNIPRTWIEKSTTSILYNDPIDQIKKMAGVDSIEILDYTGPSLGITRFKVRGGDYFENVALIDNIYVKYPFHTIMWDSVFIEELIDEINIYKGVLPVEYGQSLSSLLQIKSVKGENLFNGKFHTGLMNTYIAFYGITENKQWNYNFGIKRTYYDLIMSFFTPNTTINENSDWFRKYVLPYYTDLYGKVEYDDNVNNFSVNCLLSFENQLSMTSNAPYRGIFEENTEYKVNNFIGNLHYKSTFFKNFFWNNIILFSLREDNFHYKNYSESYYDNIMTSQYSGNYKVENEILLKSLFEYLWNNTYFKLGTELILSPELKISNFSGYWISNINETNINTNTNVIYYLNNFNSYSKIYSVFYENIFNLYENIIQLNCGIRINYYDIIKKISYDPRLTLNFSVFKNSDLYISIGSQTQFPTYPDIIQWIDFNDNNINIPGVIHYIVGFNSILMNSYFINFEVYMKDYNNSITYYFDNEGGYHLTTFGNDKHTYGYEFSIFKKSDQFPFYGWITFGGYKTWAYRTLDSYFFDTKKSGGFFAQALSGNIILLYLNDEILQNLPIPSTNNWYISDSQNYKLNIILIWELNKNWTITSEFLWKSGQIYTPIIGVTNNQIIFGDYNSAYLPDIHRLSIKIEWKFQLWNYPSCLYFQIYNIYNNPLIFGVNYNEKGEIINYESIFWILPSAGFWIKW